MTYSIVARDAATGELGVAVQTRWFGAGAGVPWAEAGVGAVATQSFTEIAHGPNGLARLRAGESAADALAALVATDDGREVRQVGIVDASGRSASFSGLRCVPAAGHVTAEGVAIQANMMERATVWPAMLRAWQATGGSLVDRLLAALRAAEDEGGDIRGRQSAAILVVSGDPARPAWERTLDVRVEDAADPLGELERLVRLERAYGLMDRAEDLQASGDGPGAIRAWDEAIDLAPHDDQVALWRAIGLAAAGRLEDGRAELARATATNPRWRTFVERFADSGAVRGAVEPSRLLLGG